MTSAAADARRVPAVVLVALVVLLALRLPSLVEPAGGDQGLYLYSAQRVLAGAVPYRDAWDQKPPGIVAVYAVLSSVWPHESIVPAADLLAAVATTWLLVVMGRRRGSPGVGYGAAAVFLLLGDPSLQRLGGVYVRGQCEPFIAVAAAGGLALLAAPDRSRWRLVTSGLCLAAAFWLKYNAVACALPFALAVWSWRSDPHVRVRRVFSDLCWMFVGFLVPAGAFLLYFAANHALHDFWLATIVYNLRYSNETYGGPASLPLYLLTFPLARARADLLWFVGGLGALLLARRARTDRLAVVALGWLVAVVVSIAINGQRGEPNYFVQANPALALAAAAGAATLRGSLPALRYAVLALLAAGLWRVGDEGPIMRPRLGGLAGLVENVRGDLAYARGAIDRTQYLQRFAGQKYDALAADDLTRYVEATTAPSDPIYVFGFLGGLVCADSHRVSASRFFWSRPVTVEFAADEPGYGSKGVLAELERRPPAVVALQKEQWHSAEFFMGRPALAGWLRAGYVLDRETPAFIIWRRR